MKSGNLAWGVTHAFRKCSYVPKNKKGKSYHVFNGQNQSRKMFFSYDGFMLAIYRSNSGNAHRFRNWANKVVYTAHVGTPDQRMEQAIEMLGANADMVKEVFRTCVAKVPCVYLFHIGKVVDMRHSYPDLNRYKSGMLFKYGRTDNLSRRLGEHMGTFGTLEKNDFKLCYWSPINVNNVVTAESQLSTFFDVKKIAFLNHAEVVLLKKGDLPPVKEKYLEIYNDLGIVCDMVALVKQNKKLISASQAQKLLLEEKDKMVVRLNLQIEEFKEREKVWLDRERGWNRERLNFEKKEEEWSKERQGWNLREDFFITQIKELQKRRKRDEPEMVDFDHFDVGNVTNHFHNLNL